MRANDRKDSVTTAKNRATSPSTVQRRRIVEFQLCACSANPGRFGDHKLGKCCGLEEDSFLGPIDIDLDEIDIHDLLDSNHDHFCTDKQLVKNGLSVASSSLIDTGAGGYGFIDAKFLNLTGSRLGATLIPLKKEVNVKGYDGNSPQGITHAVRFSIQIDGRRIDDEPLLVLNLGNHEIILGRKWLAEHNILKSSNYFEAKSRHLASLSPNT